MPTLQKSYLYKIFRNGNFLGNLPNVTSDFGYSQDINSAGTQIQITCATSADTSAQANDPILDDTGVNITDDTGSNLLTDRASDVIGNDNSSILIRNDNDILVYEFSAIYPNGKLMFTGYISSLQANYGGTDDDQITITALSNGTELGNALVPGGTALIVDQSQTNHDDFGTLLEGGVGDTIRIAQAFTVGAGINNIAAVTVSLEYVSTPRTVTLGIYNNVNEFNGTLPLASASILVTDASYTDYTFTFAVPVTVNPGQQYIIICNTENGDTTGVNIYIHNSVSYGGGNGWVGLNLIGNANFWSINTTQELYFKTYYSTNTTVNTYTGQDPATTLKTILDSYIAQGGQLIEAGSYVATGVTATVTFNINTILEAIQTLLTVSPSNWYWYVDVATQIIYFQAVATTATYTIVKGKHITSLQLKATIENLKNIVYFSGGDTGSGLNLFVRYADTASIARNNNRIGLDRISNSNIVDNPTGLVIAQNDADGHLDEEYQTQVSILDQTMDITLPKVGDTIGFSGFGNFVDTLLLQIVRINYTPEVLTLTLGKLPPRTNIDIQNLKNAVNTLQTLSNPTAPS